MLKKKYFIIIILSLLTLPTFADHKQHRKETVKNYKFPFWGAPKRYKNEKYMQIFDRYAIFDFDKEISIAVTNTKEKQDEFKKNMKLLNIQIEYLEKELVIFIQEHKIYTNRSQEILDTYIKLFDLSTESYTLMDIHTKSIQKIFQDTYQSYNIKVQKEISNAIKNPDMLTEELLKRYECVTK